MYLTELVKNLGNQTILLVHRMLMAEVNWLAKKAFLKSGVTYAILRTSWIFSAHGKNFVKTMLDLSKTQKTLNIVADQVGGPTPARDILLVPA